jgi:hypothetical protein
MKLASRFALVHDSSQSFTSNLILLIDVERESTLHSSGSLEPYPIKIGMTSGSVTAFPNTEYSDSGSNPPTFARGERLAEWNE